MHPAFTHTLRVPRRRPAQKSSLGCDTCRARKIKCDEKRPSCTQCKIKRTDCPGYPTRPRLRWSTKHEIFDGEPLNPKYFVPAESIGQRTHVTEKKSPLENHHASGNDGSQESHRGGTHLSDFHFPDPTSRITLNDQIQSTNYNTMENMHDPYLSDIWSKELYRIIINPGDAESPTCEDQENFSDSSSSSNPNVSRPSLATFQDGECPQQDTNIILKATPGEFWVDDSYEYKYQKGASLECDTTTAVDRTTTPLVLENPPFALCAEPGGSTFELVPFYFSVVCPILSTFDSDKNVFRTFVSKTWQNSPTMFWTIQSLAAAKLVWFKPDMKAPALQYRSLALKSLQDKISAASFWDTEILFNVLLLGMSSSWFDITDLGINHLEAVQQAIMSGKVKFSDDFDTISFFRNALIYWEMVSCAVSDAAVNNDYSTMKLEQLDTPSPRPSIDQNVHNSLTRSVPHPWTGVAPEPQALFSRISRQIHGLRTPGSAGDISGPSLERPQHFMETLRDLDEAVWSYTLPKLQDISNTGDPNTPAVHHLLLAEAYMFSNLYQLYFIFSQLRRKRVRIIKGKVALCEVDQTSWAGAQVSSWTKMLMQEDGTEKWLNFLGYNAIIRLEQIQPSSGTSCVQALLLLVASTSLSLNSSTDEGDGDGEEARSVRHYREKEAVGREEILRVRQFVLDRLDCLCMSNLSAPIQYVRNVVVEIFKRLDVGADVFWLDVLQSMGLLTIIG